MLWENLRMTRPLKSTALTQAPLRSGAGNCLTGNDLLTRQLEESINRPHGALEYAHIQLSSFIPSSGPRPAGG